PIGDHARLRVPKLTNVSPPTGDPKAVNEVAKLLVSAENPVIVGGLAVRTAECMKMLVELAETVQAPVVGGKFRLGTLSAKAADRWSAVRISSSAWRFRISGER